MSKINLDHKKCIICGLCVILCPDVFQWNDKSGTIKIIKNITKSETIIPSCVEGAINACPVKAISIFLKS